MVNFIKASGMNAEDFNKWLYDHQQFIPKGDDEKYDPLKMLYVTVDGYKLAFVPKYNNQNQIQKKDGNNVVPPAEVNVSQPKTEVELVREANNSQNNPPIQQTTIAVSELPADNQTNNSEKAYIPNAPVL